MLLISRIKEFSIPVFLSHMILKVQENSKNGGERDSGFREVIRTHGIRSEHSRLIGV